MKKADYVLWVLFVLIVSFSFLGFSSKNISVQAQTTSSSSDVSPSPSETTTASPTTTPSAETTSTPTSSPEETPTSSVEPTVSPTTTIVPTPSASAGVSLNPNFTGIWKAKVKERIPTSSPPSSPTTTGSASPAETTSAAPQESETPTVTSTSTPTSSAPTKVLGHLAEEGRGSAIITFKLCVRDGKLEGLVHQGGAFLTGKITSQNVISADEVEFTAESKDGRTAMIHLKLTGERQFIGTFADGDTFEGRKLNENRGCLTSGKVPGKPGRPGPSSSVSPGGIMGGSGGMMDGPGMGGPITTGSPFSGLGMGGPGSNMFGGEDIEKLYPTSDFSFSRMHGVSSVRHKPKKPKKSMGHMG